MIKPDYGDIFQAYDPFQPLNAEQVERLRKELEAHNNRTAIIMPGTFQPRIEYIGPPPRYEPPLEDTP